MTTITTMRSCADCSTRGHNWSKLLPVDEYAPRCTCPARSTSAQDARRRRPQTSARPTGRRLLLGRPLRHKPTSRDAGSRHSRVPPGLRLHAGQGRLARPQPARRRHRRRHRAHRPAPAPRGRHRRARRADRGRTHRVAASPHRFALVTTADRVLIGRLPRQRPRPRRRRSRDGSSDGSRAVHALARTGPRTRFGPASSTRV
ncbi:hypothetical protein HBB16_10010 [Pseudonocardia sp. MCCB 268]|nr:hypothetical protein [Pseudonocardia cytotoxica]